MTTPTERLRAALGDRYRLEREVGSGGMATVYLAEDLRHHRKVALKVLRPDLAASLGPDRFLREITIAAGLTHPHILPLHDSGEVGGTLFYVMPYVEGQSLRQKLGREGELPVADAVRILRDVADAMAHAHSHGVVHRDIKPENVMLSGRHALVTDFGVAKAVSEATGRQTLTTAGVALGTPAYMAPEQAAADPHTDHRADIYAWGVLAYELLTGRPPFVRSSPQAVLAAHVTEAVEPIVRHRGSLSPQLAHLVMRALEKKPADRWQSAEELVSQLEAVLTPSGGMTPTSTQPVTAVQAPTVAASPAAPRPRWLLPAVAAGLVLAAFAGWWFLGRAPDINPALVVVAPFENRSGDASLDRLGLELAERVTLALARSGAGEAVPAARLRELVGSATAGSPDLARKVARASGAGLLISGSYGGEGDALEVRAELLRMPAGDQVSLIEAVSGVEGTALSDTVAERLAVAVVANADWGDRWGWGTEHRLPRSLGAYRAALEADAKADAGFAEWQRAVALDPGWPRALTNAARLMGADSVRAMVARASSWLPGDRAELELWNAWIVEADYDRAWQVASERLAVDTLSWLLPGMAAAYYSNRLEAAARLGTRRHEASYWNRGARRNLQAYVWMATSLHGLGRDGEALEVALEGRRLFPEAALEGITLEFTARAGLGQVAEVERLVAEAEGLRPDSVMLGGFGLTRSLVAAFELRAHGHRDASTGVANRTVGWVERQLADAPDNIEFLDHLGDALALAERWDDLAALSERMQALKPPSPYSFFALYYAGLSAAKRGDREAAIAAARQTECCGSALEPGNRLDLLAHLALATGDTVGAMDHFRSAWNAGYWGVRAHHIRHRGPVAIGLRNHPAFLELTRPRD